MSTLVWPHIIADIKHEPDGFIADLVIEDARKREAFGIEKYHGRLFTTFIGKSGLAEAYEEGLDQVAYLKLAILEEEAVDGYASNELIAIYHDTLRLLFRLRRLLHLRTD